MSNKSDDHGDLEELPPSNPNRKSTSTSGDVWIALAVGLFVIAVSVLLLIS